MVPVALRALGPFVLLESLLVFAAIKQAGVARVAETAALAHARQANRHSGMVAVTVVARRRAQIASLQQRAQKERIQPRSLSRPVLFHSLTKSCSSFWLAGSPPWQPAQERPRRKCTSSTMSCRLRWEGELPGDAERVKSVSGFCTSGSV